MAGLLRGGVYWCSLNSGVGREQRGKRPVLVISHSRINEKLQTAIIIPLTSSEQRAGFPLTLELTNPELPKRSWLKISQVRTISTSRIGTRITTVSNPVLNRAIAGLTELIA